MHGGLIGVGKNVINPSSRLLVAIAAIRVANPRPAPAARRKNSLGLFVSQASGPKLPEVVLTLGVAARLPRRIHGRQQHGDENPDDRDDHQQLYQSKAALLGNIMVRSVSEHWTFSLQLRHVHGQAFAASAEPPEGF